MWSSSAAVVVVPQLFKCRLEHAEKLGKPRHQVVHEHIEEPWNAFIQLHDGWNSSFCDSDRHSFINRPSSIPSFANLLH